ncbi:hypothetical protein FQZ97_623490 [compost metagenome]
MRDVFTTWLHRQGDGLFIPFQDREGSFRHDEITEVQAQGRGPRRRVRAGFDAGHRGRRTGLSGRPRHDRRPGQLAHEGVPGRLGARGDEDRVCLRGGVHRQGREAGRHRLGLRRAPHARAAAHALHGAGDGNVQRGVQRVRGGWVRAQRQRRGLRFPRHPRVRHRGRQPGRAGRQEQHARRSVQCPRGRGQHQCARRAEFECRVESGQLPPRHDRELPQPLPGHARRGRAGHQQQLGQSEQSEFQHTECGHRRLPAVPARAVLGRRRDRRHEAPGRWQGRGHPGVRRRQPGAGQSGGARGAAVFQARRGGALVDGDGRHGKVGQEGLPAERLPQQVRHRQVLVRGHPRVRHHEHGVRRGLRDLHRNLDGGAAGAAHHGHEARRHAPDGARRGDRLGPRQPRERHEGAGPAAQAHGHRHARRCV